MEQYRLNIHGRIYINILNYNNRLLRTEKISL